MKRLLIFSSEFPPGPGGIGTHAWQLARHMNIQGWDVNVITLQDYVNDDEVQAFNEGQSFEIRRLFRQGHWLRDYYFRFIQLRHVIQNWSPDVLVVTGDRLVWLTALILWARLLRLRCPWVSIWHGVLPRNVLSRNLSVWAFSRSDLTIGVSQYSMDQLSKQGARFRKVKIITNGADEESFRPDPLLGQKFRDALRFSKESRLLLTVGNMSERKGQDIVIRSLPNLIKENPEIHYLIVGLPTNQVPLEKLADELEVRPHVHFLGRLAQDDLNAAYNACDIFILVSRHSSDGQFEGYGIAVVEAALCEKPAVVSDNSGLTEAVQDSVTGLVVPENNPAATGKAIQRMLGNSVFSAQLGQAARKQAFTEQTWAKKMQEYDFVLTDLIFNQ